MADRGDARDGGFESTISADMQAAPEDGVLQPGTTLGDRYRIEGILGHGGMGHVYRARDLELDRHVALKTMRRSTSKEARRRFRREVELALRITHPNVVRMYDVGAADGLAFVTMEIVEGQSLRELLRDGTLSPRRAARIASSACAGLAAAHEAGVVHRDFKPENIVLTGDRVVVLDFGVAGEDLAGQRAASAIVGTSAYMSPEQANGDAPTPATDLYALGLVIHEMITGEVPLVGSGPVATALLRQRDRPPSLRQSHPDTPRDLDDLVRQLLALSPTQRPESTDDVSAQLAQIGASGQTDTRIPRAKRGGRERLVSVVAALVLVGGVSWYAIAQRGTASGKAPTIDATAQVVLTIDATSTDGLDDSLGFLAPHAGAIALRALSARLPGRIANGPVAGAAPVVVRMHGQRGSVTMTLRVGAVSAEETAPTAMAAADRAAAALVARLLPEGPRPTAKHKARATAWGTDDASLIDRFLAAQVHFARTGTLPAGGLEDLARPGFVRPHMLTLVSLGAVGPRHSSIVAQARAHAKAAPNNESVILEALIGVLSNDRSAAQGVVADPTDPWATYAIAWRGALSDRLDEGLAHANQLARDPVLGGIGARLAVLLARYYRADAVVDASRALTRVLPEAPASWLELASALASRDMPGEAKRALDRAQLLGGDDGLFDEVSAAVALSALDFPRAKAAARRLLARPERPWQLEAQRLLYAVDVITGRFDDANRRANGLGKLITAAGTTEAAEAGIWLSRDALARGEHALALRFADWASEASIAVSDHEYFATAQALRASARHAKGELDATALAAALDKIATRMRRRGHDPDTRVAVPMARLRAAAAREDCTGVTTSAKGFEREPQAIIALAGCDIGSDNPARAVARLTGMFLGVERSTAPTLFVRRELFLGRAYVKLGRKNEARRHLRRVVELWRHAADRGEVANAQKLLLGLTDAAP